jgi:hypothetical protein
MKLRIGSLELGARLEPNHWGASLGGVASWLTCAGVSVLTWGEDWKHENMGVAALIGPVTLRTELHQHPDSMRVVDVLGAFWEVAKGLPSLLEDKDLLADPEPEYGPPHWHSVIPQVEGFLMSAQLDALVGREELAEVPDGMLETLYGTTDREEILRMVKERPGDEKPFYSEDEEVIAKPEGGEWSIAVWAVGTPGEAEKDGDWHCLECGGYHYPSDERASALGPWRWTGEVWEHCCPEGVAPEEVGGDDDESPS